MQLTASDATANLVTAERPTERPDSAYAEINVYAAEMLESQHPAAFFISISARIRSCIKKEIRMFGMREKKYPLYLTDDEKRIILMSLVELRNELIKEGRYTDPVDAFKSGKSSATVR